MTMKVKVLLLTSLLIITHLAYASRYLNYLFIEDSKKSTEELIRRIEKYDANKSIRYYQLKNAQYFFDDNYVSMEGGPVALAYFFGRPSALRAELEHRKYVYVFDYKDSGTKLHMLDFEKERAVLLLSIALDDKEKAERVFHQLYDEFLEKYEVQKNCDFFCKISVYQIHDDKAISLNGSIVKNSEFQPPINSLFITQRTINE